MSINYYNKYIKYKEKYLAIKNKTIIAVSQVKGGEEISRHQMIMAENDEIVQVPIQEVQVLPIQVPIQVVQVPIQVPIQVPVVQEVQVPIQVPIPLAKITIKEKVILAGGNRNTINNNIKQNIDTVSSHMNF